MPRIFGIELPSLRLPNNFFRSANRGASGTPARVGGGESGAISAHDPRPARVGGGPVQNAARDSMEPWPGLGGGLVRDAALGPRRPWPARVGGGESGPILSPAPRHCHIGVGEAGSIW
jgi:hypothetical protein